MKRAAVASMGSPALIFFLQELDRTSNVIFRYTFCEAKCVAISVIRHLIKIPSRIASSGLMTHKVKPATITERSLSLITCGTMLNAYYLDIY
jgi:hypothetical protein